MIAVIHKYERSFAEFKLLNQHLKLSSVTRTSDLSGCCFSGYVILDNECRNWEQLKESVKLRIKK